MLQDGGWTISPWPPTDLVGLFSDTIFTTPKGRVQLSFLLFWRSLRHSPVEKPVYETIISDIHNPSFSEASCFRYLLARYLGTLGKYE